MIDDSKIQSIAKSLYEQVANNGTIKLGKVNRNHIIKTTTTVLQDEFNISTSDFLEKDMDNLYDYVAATFLQMYKIILVPHYETLLCHDIEALKQLYPDFQQGGSLADGIESELESLLAFANEMVIAIQIFSPTMQLIVDIVTVCLEGEFKKYINGSGATVTSRRRFQLFRRFKPVSPRYKRRGSGASSCATARSEEGEGSETNDYDNEHQQLSHAKGRRRSRSCESVCSAYTDMDAYSIASPSPSPSPSRRNSGTEANININNNSYNYNYDYDYGINGQPMLFPIQVHCIPEAKYMMPVSNFNQPSIYVSKPSYVNSLFPQAGSDSDSEMYSDELTMIPDSDGLEDFIELFGSDDFDADFMDI